MAYKPMIIKKLVTTKGTAERLTTSNILTPSVTIQANDDNTADAGVFVGDNQVEYTTFTGIELNARESITPKSGKGLISLRDIWIDTDNNGEGVTATYLEEV